MKVEFDISDEEVMGMVKKMVAERIVDDLFSDKCTYERNVLASMYKEVCREIIYQHKDEIVDKVVAQATVEVKKKAVQKMLETM